MYEYSLKYFTQVFATCIKSTETAADLEERLKVLRQETVYATYANICRGLFEKDKLIFSFMLTCDVLRSTDAISEKEWNFFLRGGPAVESGQSPKPARLNWMSQNTWEALGDLEHNLAEFAGLKESVSKEPVKVKIGDFKTVRNL